jgi:hypothetical protein
MAAPFKSSGMQAEAAPTKTTPSLKLMSLTDVQQQTTANQQPTHLERKRLWMLNHIVTA